MKRIALSLAALISLGYAGSNSYISDSSLGIQAGTMGIGLDFSKKITSLGDKTVLKLAVAGFDYHDNYDNTNTHYNANLKLANAGLLLDYHPFTGGFYLSTGVYYNGNKIDFDATPTNGTYIFNNTPYQASVIGYVKGKTNFNKFSPFVGLGYDNSLFGNGNLFFSAKLGAMYQGSPNVDLTGVCGPAISGTPTCVQLQQDIKVEQQSINNDINDYKWWPVVSIGLTYKF